jgi:hypothetical protein
MIDLYDHRAASYEGRGDNRGFNVLPSTTDQQHGDPTFEPLPFYWVRLADVRMRTPVLWEGDWLLGFRDVTNPLNERTFICSTLPYVGAGHTLSLVFPNAEPQLLACLIGNLSSMLLDYVAREKIGGFHTSYFHVAQLPILPPEAYDERALNFILPRVLELSYSSESMRGFAASIGFSGSPFPWNPERRTKLRAELDAYYARLYGLSRDEIRFILDPNEVFGTAYPSETFRVLREREVKDFGEYRTARLVMDAWETLSEDAALT